MRFAARTLSRRQAQGYMALAASFGTTAGCGAAIGMIHNSRQSLGYLALCVDENDQVVKSYGDTTSTFFKRFFFTLNPDRTLPHRCLAALKTLSANVLKLVKMRL